MESCQHRDEKNGVSDADGDESGDTGTGAPGLSGMRRRWARLSATAAGYPV